MRNECLNSRYGHDTPLPISRMIADLGNKMQICTQRYGKRPYGVGLLVAGYDDQGPHIFQTCPCANYNDCRECELEELVKHGLRALRDTLPNEVDLTNKNVSIAIVGKDHPFTVYDDAGVDPYLAGIEGEERRGQRA